MSQEQTILRPFFYYYGGKWRASVKYPKPKYETLIEPFAGGAGYAQRFPWLKVRLYDIDPIVCVVWNYLIHVSQKEIQSLPLEINHIDDLAVCQEAKWLIGFWFNKGVTYPRKSPSAWMRNGGRPNTFWGEAVREMIAAQLPAIRHWTVTNLSYKEIDINQQATWFVDPPYSDTCGTQYRYHDIDYTHLGNWCRELPGQVIVCEKEGADWLPFRPLLTIQSSAKRTSHETVWVKGESNDSV